MEAERLERLKKGASRGMSPRYRIFRHFMRALGWLLFGLTVHGADKVPKEGPLIVASNHRWYADPFLIGMGMPRKVQWMAKKELFVFPFEKFFYLIGSFPVDRNKSARAALMTALELLAAGWALGIFPEGTRRETHNPEDTPKSGVAMLAARSDAPILPVYVGKAPNLLQRLRGGRLHIYFGNLITLDNTKGKKQARREVAGEVLRAIYGLKGEQSGVVS